MKRALLVILLLVSSCDTKVKSLDTCGDGYLDANEQCDGAERVAQSCQELGYHAQNGTLACRDDCSLDLSVCAFRCGDGELQGEYEQCEGTHLGGQSCETLGLGGGTLLCAEDCHFDLSGCESQAVCGDGEITEPFEQCEPDDLAGATCLGLGYHGGVLACGADCRHDLTACEGFGRCGDNVIQAPYGEQCEGADLNQETCQTLGYHGGTLGCTDGCLFVLDDCAAAGRCGDGVAQTTFGERCDGDDPAQTACREFDLFFGVPACSDQCLPLPGSCTDLLAWNVDGDASIVNTYGVAADAQGNVYVVGRNYAPMHGQAQIGGTDAFLIKFGPDGQRRWTRVWGSPSSDVARDVFLAADGAIFVAGSTQGSVDGEAHAGDMDVFVSKFDADGNRLWTRQWGSPAQDEVAAIHVPASGFIHVVGTTYGNMNGQTAVGGGDAFITRLNADGSHWSTQIWGSDGYDNARDVVVNHLGDIFVTGFIRGPIDGQTHLGDSDLFLSAFNVNASRVWTRLLGSAQGDLGTRALVDAMGDVTVVGSARGPVGGQAHLGGSDVVLVKFDRTGALLWARQWGTNQDDSAQDVAQDAAGNFYVAGYTGASLVGGVPFQGGVTDGFLSRRDATGAAVWDRMWGTAEADWIHGLAVDSLGLVFLVGMTGVSGGQDGIVKTFPQM